MSGGKMAVRFVNVMQEKENLALLSHFNRSFTIHSGRNQDEPREVGKVLDTLQFYSQLYHIRTD